MIKIKKEIDIKKLFEVVDNTKEMTEYSEGAYNVIAEIVDYCDCYASFINEVPEEYIDEAIELLNEENMEQVAACAKLFGLLEDAKNGFAPTSADLF